MEENEKSGLLDKAMPVVESQDLWVAKERPRTWRSWLVRRSCLRAGQTPLRHPAVPVAFQRV